jgi:nitrate/nitrite transport system ATP-binding protein
MAYLELENLSKGYGGADPVLHEVNLAIEEGEFVAIVGFSGSGKTTLISTIAGLLAPDSGEIRLDGKAITGAGTDRGVVFQSYSLMPWLSVEGNVALAVDAAFPKWTRPERRAHVRRQIELVGLSHAMDRRPAELSGGMRQRVAVARALSMNPRILLLDEPLSALDALTRAKLQDEIEALWRRERKTVVLVTNDVDEALLLADRIIPLTPAPRATLGREFRVSIKRPRDRRELNHDPAFRQLRAQITQYLLDAGLRRGAGEESAVKLPDVIPITSSDFVPKAVRSATRTKVAANVNKFVEFYDVTKTFATPKGPLTVVDKFALDVKKGEFISLIGHSGCGKSTVLSMVAGLTDVTDGGITLDGREVVAAGPDRGVVFQAPNLLPSCVLRRTPRHHRVLPRESWALRRAGPPRERAVERHEAACRPGARLRPFTEAPAAR